MFDKKGIEVDDFSALCTTEKANEGIWKQVVAFGKKYQIEVLVIGDDSDAVKSYEREVQREAIKKLRISSQKKVTIDEDAFADDFTDIDSALVRFGGIRKLDGSPMKFTFKGELVEVPVYKNKESEKYYRAMLVGSPEVKEFIIAEAKERADFLDNGKKN